MALTGTGGTPGRDPSVAGRRDVTWKGGVRSDLLRPCSDPLPTVAEHRPIPTLVGFNKVELGSDYDANRVGLR